ncbi:hypothetical protein OPQ81_011752 [Rhizoctonia solani]|nr:hypothetical protein OPQ81_011752 [Rhizoctonia solani]
MLVSDGHPSCATPECIPNASWSTGAINSTLSFQFWGWDVAFDGWVKGNMSVQLFRNGVQEYYRHNITLKITDASLEAELTVTQARVNGSTHADIYVPADRWIVPSSDDRLEYKGAGDTLSMQFNGSTFLIYGPCGPASGLMTVTIDGRQQTVNTSKPFASDDCLLFQAQSISVRSLHQLLIENTDGRTLGIDRLEFFMILTYKVGPGHTLGAIVVSCAVMGAIILGAVTIIVYVKRAVKKKQGMELSQAARGWLKLLHS